MGMFDSFEAMKAEIKDARAAARAAANSLMNNPGGTESKLERLIKAAIMDAEPDTRAVPVWEAR